MISSLSSSASAQETATKIKALIKDTPADERADAARLDELRQIFSSLIQRGDLTFRLAGAAAQPATMSATEKWNAWLMKHHKRTVIQLADRIRVGRRTAVRTLWGLMAASPQLSMNGHGHVSVDLMYRWLTAVVEMPLDVRHDKSLKHLVEAEWAQRDVQYYAMRCMTQWATERYHQQMQKQQKQQQQQDDSDLTEQADRMMLLLMMIPFPTTQAELEMPNNRYLFPPPSTGPAKRNRAYEGATSDNDDDDDNDSNKDEADNSSDSDNEDSDDDDDNADNKEAPPFKKQRRTAPKHFAYQNVKCHLSALAKAWLALLRLPLSASSLKKALPYLSQHVLSKIRDPLRFSDLFIKAYRGAPSGQQQDDNKKNKSESSKSHANTIIPIVALDGLFYLMTQHQLEYPHFYSQLYALLKPTLFYVKYRQRFFELLQKCLLRNEMLPAHVVAAFLKRLLRCALQAPPPGALFALALSSNLLRAHEECAALIHRSTLPTTTSGSGGNDPYDPDTDDPSKSHALQSSLWELHALEQHYLPAVATLAQSIGREDPKSPLLQLDDMAQQSYASLIAHERKRGKGNGKKKGSSTPITFTMPTGLFTQDDVFAGILHVPSLTPMNDDSKQ